MSDWLGVRISPGAFFLFKLPKHLSKVFFWLTSNPHRGDHVRLVGSSNLSGGIFCARSPLPVTCYLFFLLPVTCFSCFLFPFSRFLLPVLTLPLFGDIFITISYI